MVGALDHCLGARMHFRQFCKVSFTQRIGSIGIPVADDLVDDLLREFADCSAFRHYWVRLAPPHYVG